MTKSHLKRLRPPKIRRNRTAVYLQERTIYEGRKARSIYWVSVPRWAVEEMKLRAGDGFLVHVDGGELIFERVFGLESPKRRKTGKLFATLGKAGSPRSRA